MRKILGSLLLCSLFMLLAASCGGKGESLQYFPFQTKEDGKWGLIAPDGKVLFEERFTNQPSPVYCDRFWVKDEEGYYGLHEANEEATRVNHVQYRWVTNFYNGRAFVVERDNKITIIDTKGNVKATLDSIGELEVSAVGSINNGMGIVVCDTLQGVVNLKGDVLVKPEYTYIGIPTEDGIVAFKGAPFTSTYTLSDTVGAMPDSILAKLKGEAVIYNTNGDELFTIKQKDWPVIGDHLLNGYLPVCREKNNEYAWGLLNNIGEEAMAPNTRIAFINDVQGDLIIYTSHDQKMGIMNFKGESVLPAEYSTLRFGPDDLVIADDYDYEKDGEDNETCRLLNIHGAQVGPNKAYFMIYPFFETAREYAVVMVREGRWGIINRKGERAKDVPDLYSCMVPMDKYTGESITSDYVDIPLFVGRIRMTPNGVDSLSFNSSPQQVLDRQASYYSWSNKPKASDYTSQREVSISRSIGPEYFTETIHFPNTLAQANYSQRRVIDYVDYWSGWYWYHNENVLKGHSFRSMTPSYFELTFNNAGVFRGKLSQLYAELAKRFKRMGTVVDEYKTSCVVDLGGGRQALVYMTPETVVAQWGKLSNAKGTASENARVREDLSIPAEEELGD